MAPSKPVRNKKINASQVAATGSGQGEVSLGDETKSLQASLQPADVFAKIQEDEREVLKAIFMEDFQEVEARGAWSRTTDRTLRLNLRSFSDDHISCTLCATISASYPKSLPTLTIEQHEHLRHKTLERLLSLIRSRPKELVGEVMIHDIASSIQDILEDDLAIRENDGTYENLEVERAKQEVVAANIAKENEEKLQQKLNDERAEEERSLHQMVNDEIRRKEILGKKKSRSAAHTPTSYFSVGASTQHVSFDRTIHLTSDTRVVDFSAVEGLVPFRAGSTTETLLVKPLSQLQARSLILKRSRIHAPNVANSTKLKRAITELESELEEIRALRETNVAGILDFKIEQLPDSGWEISILMEYFEKGSMGERLQDELELPVAKIRSWTVDLLEALDFYHRNGVVHKRVHPFNILLKASTNGLTVLLADTGYQDSLETLNNISHGGQSMTHSMSVFWLPAELSQDTRRTRKTDVWDLGVTFMQMLFGLDAPRRYSSPKELSDVKCCSEPLQEMLRKFFKPDPKKRPSAFDLIPCEFLRNDVPVYDTLLTPIRSRHSSLSLIAPRLRRESSTVLSGAMSRYASDWAEQGRLGKGGYGEVVKARNKVDGRSYAIKKIKQKSAAALTEVLSEVMLLSRLNHACVVRYYAAWPEDDQSTATLAEVDGTQTTDVSSAENSSDEASTGESNDDMAHSVGGLDFISSSGYPKIEFEADNDNDEEDNGAVVFEYDTDEGAIDTSAARSPSIAKNHNNAVPINSRPTRMILYIQMEFCEKQTLRDLIRRDLHEDNEEYWRLFRHILEGLAHIHSHGIIHRDLKPDNIFIDLNRTPKIGDFGLATSGQYQRSDRKHSPSALIDGDMTRSVGTALYVAPELRSTVMGNYTEKVDMYSMGIIFFEMCYPLKTAMERDHVIRLLREREHEFPVTFEQAENVHQRNIIDLLISHKPSERPSCAELLRSGKVPAQIEDEAIREALKALSDRDSPHYSRMMSALFSQKADDQVKDYTWDLVTGPSSQAPIAHDVLVQSLVKHRLTSLFRKHGAVEAQRQQLLPWSGYYANSNAVKLFDPSGNLVQLPYDLTLPYARSIGRGLHQTEKTFAIGSVFRDNHTGGAPRSSGEVDFDILSNDTLDLALKEAEVIKVVDEIIDEFPSLSSTPVCFHLNHTNLLDLVLDLCRIGAPQRPAVKEVLSKLNINKFNFAKIRNELRAPGIGIPSTSLDDLARFDWRDTPEKAFVKLRRQFEGTKQLDQTHAIFAHLNNLISYTKQWGVKRKVYVNALSSFNDKFYAGGVLFQCLLDGKQREVLAAGGRYDKLIAEYRPKGFGHAHTTAPSHAVGVNIGWERLVSSMIRHSKRPEKNILSKKHNDPDAASFPWQPRRCDCLVASFDPTTLRSLGVKLVAELLADGYSAELAIDARNLEELIRHYRDDRHSWIIVVKHAIAHDKPDLKVKSVDKKEDTDLRQSELSNYLRNEMRDRDAREGHAASRSAGPTTASSSESSARANVDVLMAQHRSKKTNKWSIVDAAQHRSAELLSSFSTAPIAAIEAKDEVMSALRDTRLGDPESWRKVVQSLPMSERKYMQELQDLLSKYASEWKQAVNEGTAKIGEGGKAFVYNFRTGACLLYDLET